MNMGKVLLFYQLARRLHYAGTVTETGLCAGNITWPVSWLLPIYFSFLILFLFLALLTRSGGVFLSVDPAYPIA